MAVQDPEYPSGLALDCPFFPNAHDSAAILQYLDSKPRDDLKAAMRIQNPVPSPMYLPEIQTPLTPLDTPLPLMMPITTVPNPTRPTLLTIPLEIRLHIYSYIQICHPVQHAHLSPMTTPQIETAYAEEEIRCTTFHPQPTSLINHELGHGHPTHITHSIPTTSPLSRRPCDENKPIGAAISQLSSIPRRRTTQTKLPTQLLLACKKIYGESHWLPFQTSHFAFVNWFSSGVYAARQFSRSLRPWQRDAMRWVDVEVLGRDLWSGGGIAAGERGVGEWVELCRLWGGVRGLRVAVKGNVLFEESGGGGGEWDVEGGKILVCGSVRGKLGVHDNNRKGVLDTDLQWVKLGLLSMKELRWVGIEIEDEHVSRDTKLRFCDELAAVWSRERTSDAWMGNVKVVFVERVKIVEEAKGYPASESGDGIHWAVEA